MISAHTPGHDTALAPRSLLWLAIVGFGAAFFCVEHEPFISTTGATQFANDAGHLERDAAQGSVLNKVGYLLAGMVGALFLLRRTGRQLNLNGLLPVLVLVGMLWCLASITWSIDVWRTSKNLIILIFCLAGALGACRQFSTQQLVVLVWAVSTGFMLGGIGIEVLLGTFRPWSSTYRFAGTLHPNGAGANCLMVCLSTFLLLRHGIWRRAQWGLLAILVLSIVLLYATRSRSSFAACALVVGAVWLVGTSAKAKLVASVATVWTGSLTLLVAQMLHLPVLDRITSVFLMGRTSSVSSLNGRTELWEHVVQAIGQRPWTGYGYAAFWNDAHVYWYSKNLGWAMNSAHSFYLDAALGLGWTGLTMLLLVLVVVLWMARSVYRRTGDPMHGLALGMLLQSILTGLTESSLMLPSFTTFVTVIGVLELAFFVKRRSSPAAMTAADRSSSLGMDYPR